MTKRESIIRYYLIIKKLRKNPATFDELASYLQLESHLQDYHFDISKRTFHRDLDDIRSIYDIDIQYDFSRKVYFIDFDEHAEINERVFEAFNIFNALNLSARLSEHIHFEKRKPLGTENLYGLLHAIKNKVQISFTHHNYWDDIMTTRTVEPYALKEFKNRWYVLANDLKDNHMKSFALDRITALEITSKPFKSPVIFNINEHYRYCFGIISPNKDKPYNIILSFEPHQGNYIKSLPLHETQVVLKDNDDEFQIGLTLFITHDFIMELLSYGENVKVIKPASLIKKLKSAYQNALDQY